MPSTRNYAESISLLARLSSMKAPILRVAKKTSVAYGRKFRSARSLPVDITGHDVALAPGWPLPYELTNYEVAQYLSRQDIVNLGLTNKAMFSSVVQDIYSTSSVELRSNARCRDTLEFLASRPDVAGYITSLVIAPNYLEYYSDKPRNWKKRLVKEELVIARLLERVIPNLHSLREFRWDGLEMPMDSVWSTLRTHCPLLKTIGTSTGERPINPDSELFAFDDLLSFSLSGDSHGFSVTSDHDFKPERLPESLIQMLLYRCPDLEKLTIGPAAFVPWECRRRFDVFPFLGKSWPKLRVLNLEHAEFNALSVSSVELTVPHLREMIDSFLVNLPNLQELMGMPILFDIQIEASLPLTLGLASGNVNLLQVYHQGPGSIDSSDSEP